MLFRRLVDGPELNPLSELDYCPKEYPKTDSDFHGCNREFMSGFRIECRIQRHDSANHDSGDHKPPHPRSIDDQDYLHLVPLLRIDFASN